MPWVEDKEEQFLGEKLIGLGDEEGATSSSSMDIAMAEFRTENTIGSIISRSRISGLPDNSVTNPDFNPWDHFTEDEKLDEKFSDNAALADSVEEIDAVRKLTNKERKDRKTIAEGGAMSVVLGFGIGGIGDPINLIPIGGTIAKTYKAGHSILTSAMVVGGISAASTAAQESILHMNQIERTMGESAVNMSAAFLLGGVLGGGVEALSKWKINPSTLKEIEDTMDVEVRINNGDDSIGAARVADDFKVKGKLAEKMVKFSPDPLSRNLTSDNPFTRKYMNFLAENPIAGEKGNQTAVESLIKIHEGKYVRALEGHLGQLKSMRKRLGEGVKEKLLSKGMTRKKFNELVSREVRDPGIDTPIEIKSAAKVWINELYNPLKNQLIKTGLLDEGVDVKTAINYLNRSWNKHKLSANLPVFLNKTSKWLKDEDLNLFAAGKKALIDVKKAKGKEKIELERLIKKSKFKEGLDLDEIDYDDIAEQIYVRISGTPDGVLPYDFKIGEGSVRSGINGTGLKSPLKSRVFNVPDKDFEEFFENDIEKLGARYLKQVSPDLELHKAFDGDIDLVNVKKDISLWWNRKIEKETDQKAIRKMLKKRDNEIRDIVAVKDRMRGTYGKVADPNAIWVRAARSARDLNYLRFMGGVVASSIPDIARTFAAEGFVNTLKFGLKPLVKNLKEFKVAASEGKAYGIGADGLLGGRAEIMADISDYTQGGTAFERGLRTMAQGFGKVNLMNQWTSAMKQLHVVTMQNSIIDSLSKGKYDKRLSRLGIDESNAKLITAQIKQYGGKSGDSFLSGAKNWDNARLERMWGAALRKESDRVIVMPGQEKPLFMSTEMGKTLFQFRSFMMSATQRMLISGVQGQDANYFGGALMLTGLGMLAYTFKQWDAGRKISSDPRVLITEGIDRSGMLGMLMEINNTIEKVSNNNYGLRPMIGAKQPSSRFASRNKGEALLGPTFGSFLSTTLKVLGAGSDDNEWKESDTRALRRLIPYQNLMILRQAFDKLEGRK